MEPLYVLTASVLLLAFVGYVGCLSRIYWVTVLATGAVGFYAARSVPPDTDNAIVWATAGVAFLAALMVVRVLPKTAQPRQKPPQGKRGKSKDIVIDGTNVIYWDGDADLDTLRVVVRHLMEKGFAPIVFLDASTRHHLKEPSLDARGFARILGLRRDRVMVCPAQTEADAFILKFAKAEGLPIVSNDRFGDRAQQAKGLKLVKGVLARGKPILQGL